MGRVKTYDDDLRQRLVDEAGRLLTAEGISAVTLRRVAGLAGTSTTAVYSLFGDKDGLLTAMYTDGFGRLGRALTKAWTTEPDPLAGLAAVGMAYRRAALATPHLYGLMFGGTAPSFAPDEQAAAVAQSAYEPLHRGIQACMDAGRLTVPSADLLARYLWALSHGLVSLELAGFLDGPARVRQAAYREAMVMSTLPYLVNPPA